MSGELAAKLRLVRCPQCRLLLPEFPHYTVYKCGGCGKILEAKKRKNEAVNPESSARETDAAPRNKLNLVFEDKECSNGEQPVLPQEKVLRTKTASFSSGECSLDVNGGRDQNENGECDEKQLVLPQENVARTNSTRSSSGERSLDINGGGHQNENGECNGKKLVLPQENVLRTKPASSSSGECSLDVNGGRDQNENGECDEKQLVLPQENVVRTNSTRSSSGERSLDINGGGHQNENGECNGKKLVLPQENVLTTKSTSSSSGECMLDENGRKDQNKNGGSNGEQLVIPHENIRRTEATSSSSGEYSLDEIVGRDQNENGEFKGEQLGPFNLWNKDLENEMDTYNLSDIRLKQHRVYNKGGSTELPQRQIEASSVKMGENSEEEQLICASDGLDAQDKSALIRAKPEVDITRSDATAKSLTTDNFASENRSISVVTPCKPEEGSISGNPLSSPNKQMEQAQGIIHNSLDRVMSVDTFDTSEVITPSSQLSGTLGELSKSPTTRSSQAYDGSVSSYDGMDKRFPNQYLNPIEHTYNVANAVSEGRHRKGKEPIDSMNFSSDLPRGKHHIMKDSKRNRSKVLETTRHDRPVRHWTRVEREEYPSRMPFHRSGSQSGYESNSPVNQMHEELYRSSSFLTPNSCDDSDQEKMKLLRMIYKLQNQLNRTSSLNGETNGRLSTGVSFKGKHIPASSHSHDFYERRFSHDLGDPWGNGRYSQGINWLQRHKFSRIPFSAEATSSMHHVDDSCFHCRPQEWLSSSELPPHVLCQHEELYSRFHPSHNCCFSHRSYPSSAQWFMGSKPPLYGRQRKSDDQRHRAYEMRTYFREKQNLTRRHFRPVAGGAPFVTCGNCFKLLQLPADFLLFKRVSHQLKCGACSEILRFSLQNGSHIVSYAPNATGPPSRELNDRSEVINGSNTALVSDAHYFHSSHAVPISYSDDYGPSVCKSYSSEGDPLSLTPFHDLHGSECDPNVFRGRFGEKERIASRHSSISKTQAETYESTGVSSNMSRSEKLSSEMKVPPPPPRSSPLHQLMGYSSPSQVIRGVPSSGEGNELMHHEEQHLS